MSDKQIKVGQKWRRRNGSVATVKKDDGTRVPILTMDDDVVVWHFPDGRAYSNGKSEQLDLVELIDDTASESAIQEASVREQLAEKRQVGGTHYKDMAIQPVQYIHANGIGYFEGCVIKYVSRWRVKNGIEDLRKAIHFLELLIELETAENKQ